MEVIQNETVTGKTVVLDDKHLVNCKYTDCKVLYSGGDFAMTDSALVNCQITLTGPAQKTAAVLGMFGIIPPSGSMPPQSGKFGFKKDSGGNVQ